MTTKHGQGEIYQKALALRKTIQNDDTPPYVIANQDNIPLEYYEQNTITVPWLDRKELQPIMIQKDAIATISPQHVDASCAQRTGRHGLYTYTLMLKNGKIITVGSVLHWDSFIDVMQQSDESEPPELEDYIQDHSHSSSDSEAEPELEPPPGLENP